MICPPEEEMRAEVALMISILESHQAKRGEIRKQALDFLTDVHYGEDNAAKAERWLHKNFDF